MRARAQPPHASPLSSEGLMQEAAVMIRAADAATHVQG